MTILRRLALDLLPQNTSLDSLKIKRYHAGLDNNCLLQILSDSVFLNFNFFYVITLRFKSGDTYN